MPKQVPWTKQPAPMGRTRSDLGMLLQADQTMTSVRRGGAQTNKGKGRLATSKSGLLIAGPDLGA